MIFWVSCFRSCSTAVSLSCCTTSPFVYMWPRWAIASAYPARCFISQS